MPSDRQRTTAAVGRKGKGRPPRKTAMRGFGGTERVNHDSGGFYARRMFSGGGGSTGGGGNGGAQTARENDIGACRDTVMCGDSTSLSKIPDSSVHLMVTSPPYNVGKDYDADMDMDQYLGMLDRVFAETYRVLVPGGRACVNIANVGRRPYVPLHSHIITLMLKNQFLMRGEVIWDKGRGAGTSTAWGSWMSASNPTLRDTHEYILIFSKGRFDRRRDGKRKSTITRDEFLEYTKSVWSFGPERAKKVNHPAPFPVELPRRCIQLYTFEGDVVLDPFGGSGTAAVAAIRTNRHFVSVDINSEYATAAEKRVESELARAEPA